MSGSPLVILGAGGHGRVVLDAARSAGLCPAFFVDDAPHTEQLDGVVVHPTDHPEWLGLVRFRFVVAIGHNATRSGLFQRLLGRGGEAVSVIHPAAVISKRATVGPGSVAFAGVVVNPGARIGCNVILNTGCSVDHDCHVEDHVHLCPGVRLAGTVTVQVGAMLGTGSVVVPGRTVGAWAMTGAGSVMARDVPARRVVFGNPSRVIRWVSSADAPEEEL